eukprot:3000953-Amphidinium_carterae.1
MALFDRIDLSKAHVNGFCAFTWHCGLFFEAILFSRVRFLFIVSLRADVLKNVVHVESHYDTYQGASYRYDFFFLNLTSNLVLKPVHVKGFVFTNGVLEFSLSRAFSTIDLSEVWGNHAFAVIMTNG